MAWQDRILFGASYYHEYMPHPRLQEDFELMRAAGFSVIRVGESVWSRWEPREGEYNLDWLAPILDAAHSNGIGVIIGTPSYAVPPWLRLAYPATTAERAPGQPIPYGHRQDVDFSNADYRRLVHRVVTKIVERYRSHPAVIGWQIDNEPGAEILHNPGVRAGFLEYLRERYGTPSVLNDEWGLAYWAHEINDWDELWTADSNTVPSYDLEWRRYQATLTEDFIVWQAALVRDLIPDSQFVTTCLDRKRPALDLHALAHKLDLTGINIYYETPLEELPAPDQSGLRTRTVSMEPGTAAGLSFFSDLARGARQERFLVTETNASSTFGVGEGDPVFDGQLRLAAWAMIGRGAGMIEYWHWHTNHYGNETYWGGVLGHSLEPGRTYREVAALGREINELQDDLRGLEPDSSVAVLLSKDAEWAMEFHPPLAFPSGAPDPQSYLRFVRAFYDGFAAEGVQADVVDIRDFTGEPADVTRWPVVVATALYIDEGDLLKRLDRYVSHGGHLILGPRTGYADHLARPKVAVMPAELRASAGVIVTEYNTLRAPIEVTSDVFDPGGAVDYWVDCLETEDAEVLARCAHPHFKQFAAVTTRKAGAGRVTTVGGLPSRSLSASIARWVRSISLDSDPWSGKPEPITVSSGVNSRGDRIWFLHNWSWEPTRLSSPINGRLLGQGGGAISAGDVLHLKPWDVVLVAQER